jgi:hypothetical protein
VILVSNNAPGGVSGWISTNGGYTWARSDTSVGESGGDPGCSISKATGVAGRFIRTHMGDNSDIVASYKDSASAHWNEVQIYSSEAFPDKPHVWTDNYSTGPYGGRIYCGWDTDAEVLIAESEYNGASWASPYSVQLGNIQAIARRFSPNLHTDSNGVAYAVWSLDDSDGAAKSIGFSKSTNGGGSWSAETVIRNITGGCRSLSGECLGGGKTMRVQSIPSMTIDQGTGHVYVVWASLAPPSYDETDIYLIKSTNGGTSWSPAKRVNQDSYGNGKDQWFPWIAWVECTGELVVAYLDSRAFANNDSAHTYVSVSSDTSSTWHDFRVSDRAWSADDAGGGYDYIGVATGDGRAFPVWSEDRSSAMRPYVSPFLLWGVIQDSVAVSINYVPGDTIDVTATWATNLSATDGDQLVLIPPSQQQYTSQLCANCTTEAGKHHSLTISGRPCSTGTWKYTVLSSRAGCTGKRYSNQKEFKVRNCID